MGGKHCPAQCGLGLGSSIVRQEGWAQAPLREEGLDWVSCLLDNCPNCEPIAAIPKQPLLLPSHPHTAPVPAPHTPAVPCCQQVDTHRAVLYSLDCPLHSSHAPGLARGIVGMVPGMREPAGAASAEGYQPGVLARSTNQLVPIKAPTWGQEGADSKKSRAHRGKPCSYHPDVAPATSVILSLFSLKPPLPPCLSTGEPQNSKQLCRGLEAEEVKTTGVKTNPLLKKRCI